jgi:hypothetical protein
LATINKNFLAIAEKLGSDDKINLNQNNMKKHQEKITEINYIIQEL